VTHTCFLRTRIAAIEAAIIAHEEALVALGTDGIVSYTLDTSQTRQTVTRADAGRISQTVTSLYNTLATLNARLHGSTSLVRPAW
jgi:hypothetical protein